ncbi:MAG: hypothetical protein ACQEP1_00780 [Nanobdellota archaeon]
MEENYTLNENKLLPEGAARLFENKFSPMAENLGYKIDVEASGNCLNVHKKRIKKKGFPKFISDLTDKFNKSDEVLEYSIPENYQGYKVRFVGDKQQILEDYLNPMLNKKGMSYGFSKDNGEHKIYASRKNMIIGVKFQGETHSLSRRVKEEIASISQEENDSKYFDIRVKNNMYFSSFLQLANCLNKKMADSVFTVTKLYEDK